MDLMFPDCLTGTFAGIGLLENLELEHAGELTAFQVYGCLFDQRKAQLRATIKGAA